jgi:lipopolysaccharide transport system permease protein
MKKHATSLVEFFAIPWRNRSLLMQMVVREILGRYRGSIFGLVWSLFNPLLMLGVYTFVFSVVFKARWHVEMEGKTEFAIVLFAGMIVFGLFAECLNRAPNLILENSNFVKKVIFPLEIFPWVSVGAALFHALISLAVLMAFMLLAGNAWHATIIMLPLVILPVILLALGFGWLLGSLGVYLRDVGQVIGLATTALMFLSPVFYPLSALPEELRSYLALNPLAFVIESARDVVIWGRVPDLQRAVVHIVMALLVAWGGFFWFQKTRSGFADVL